MDEDTELLLRCLFLLYDCNKLPAGIKVVMVEYEKTYDGGFNLVPTGQKHLSREVDGIEKGSVELKQVMVYPYESQVLGYLGGNFKTFFVGMCRDNRAGFDSGIYPRSNN